MSRDSFLDENARSFESQEPEYDFQEPQNNFHFAQFCKEINEIEKKDNLKEDTNEDDSTCEIKRQSSIAFRLRSKFNMSNHNYSKIVSILDEKPVTINLS
jgi:hypothetical protein